MGDDQDTWLGGLGVDVDSVVQSVTETIGAVTEAVQAMPPIRSAAIPDPVSAVTSRASAAVEEVQELGAGVVENVNEALGDDAGQAREGLLADGGGAIAAETDGGTDGGSTDAGGPEEPVFSHSEGTVNVLADSPGEFISGANAKMGGTGTAGHLEIAPIEWNLELDGNDRVTHVNMKVKSKIVRPTWGGGRPRGDEANVIKKAETLIQQHEQQHRNILVDFMRRAVAGARGKKSADAEKLLNKFLNDYEAAQKAFDAREGQLEVVVKDTKEVDVRTVPLSNP